MRPVPEALVGRAFTRREAHAAGVTDRMLQGRRFTAVHPGVYRTADTPPTFGLLASAALLVAPPDAALSHLSALRAMGLAMGPLVPIHLATNHPHQAVRSGVVLHRYRHQLVSVRRHDHPTTVPARTFVDSATVLGDRRLLAVGDWLVAQGHLTLDGLRDFAERSHLDGVRRARRVAALVRAGSASVRESEVRWTLHSAGLPEPELNADIHDEHGRWLARGDLVYRRWKVVVEYDGWQHERDAAQRQWDHLRREQLEAAGWRVIVVTTADLAHPWGIVARVRQALASAR